MRYDDRSIDSVWWAFDCVSIERNADRVPAYFYTVLVVYSNRVANNTSAVNERRGNSDRIPSYLQTILVVNKDGILNKPCAIKNLGYNRKCIIINSQPISDNHAPQSTRRVIEGKSPLLPTELYGRYLHKTTVGKKDGVVAKAQNLELISERQVLVLPLCATPAIQLIVCAAKPPVRA